MFDEATRQANLYWRWDGSSMEIFRHLTKTLVINGLPGQNDVTGYGSQPGSGNEQGTKSPAWAGVAQTVAAMISNDGRFSLSGEIGTVTITDTPEAVSQIEDYIKSLNTMNGANIAIRTEVYEVTLNKGQEFGAGAQLIAASMPGTRAAGDGVNIVAAGPTLNDQMYSSQNFIEALSQYAKVSLITSSSVYTTNGRSVPVEVVDERSYLAEVRSEFEIIPGVTTSGISMSLLPRLESDGAIMLQVGMDLSQLNEVSSFGANGSRIQLPSKSSTRFVQRASIRSGEMLVLSGFEKVGALNKSGRWGSSADRKAMTIVVITPHHVVR
jgi:type IVB pilus formation R64 PilN family outer membrane protein